jgi:hypothetical protein
MGQVCTLPSCPGFHDEDLHNSIPASVPKVALRLFQQKQKQNVPIITFDFDFLCSFPGDIIMLILFRVLKEQSAAKSGLWKNFNLIRTLFCKSKKFHNLITMHWEKIVPYITYERVASDLPIIDFYLNSQDVVMGFFQTNINWWHMPPNNKYRARFFPGGRICSFKLFRDEENIKMHMYEYSCFPRPQYKITVQTEHSKIDWVLTSAYSGIHFGIIIDDGVLVQSSFMQIPFSTIFERYSDLLKKHIRHISPCVAKLSWHEGEAPSTYVRIDRESRDKVILRDLNTPHREELITHLEHKMTICRHISGEIRSVYCPENKEIKMFNPVPEIALWILSREGSFVKYQIEYTDGRRLSIIDTVHVVSGLLYDTPLWYLRRL